MAKKKKAPKFKGAFFFEQSSELRLGDLLPQLLLGVLNYTVVTLLQVLCHFRTSVVPSPALLGLQNLSQTDESRREVSVRVLAEDLRRFFCRGRCRVQENLTHPDEN